MSRLLKTRRGHDSEDDYTDSDGETYNTSDMDESIHSLSEEDQSDFDYESTDEEYTETETETGTETETDSETDSEEDSEDEQQQQQMPVFDRQVTQDGPSNVAPSCRDGSLTPTNNNILVQVDDVSTDSNTPTVDETPATLHQADETLSKFEEETHVDNNNNNIVEEMDYEATKEKRIQEHREYRRKLAEDPSFVPYVGLFWSHDDRYRDDAFSETRTGQSSTDTSIPHFTSVQQNRVHPDRNMDPLMYKKWDHSGYEELCKLDEEEEKLKRIAIENGQDPDKRHVEKERENRDNSGQRYQHFNNHHRNNSNRNYHPRHLENHAWATATPELLYEHDKVPTSILVDTSTHDNEPVTKKDKAPWITTTIEVEAVNAWKSVDTVEEIVTLKVSTPDIKVPSSSESWSNVEKDVAATGWGSIQEDVAATGWGSLEITPESKSKTGILVDIQDIPVEKTIDSTSQRSNWNNVNKLNTEVSKTTWGNARQDATTNTAQTWEIPEKVTTTLNNSWETPKKETINLAEVSNWGTIDQSVALDNNWSDNTNPVETIKETTDDTGVTQVKVKWDECFKSTPGVVDNGWHSNKKTEEPVADQFQDAESVIGTTDIPTAEKASSSWAELSANAEPERVYERRTERPFYSRTRNNYEDNRHSNHVGYYKQNYQHNRSPLHKSTQPKESWNSSPSQNKEWANNTSNSQFGSTKDWNSSTPTTTSGWGETSTESWDSKKPQVDNNNFSKQRETPSISATTTTPEWGVPATSTETTASSGWDVPAVSKETSTASGWDVPAVSKETSTASGWDVPAVSKETSTASGWDVPGVPKETITASGWGASTISKESPASGWDTPAVPKETSTASGWGAPVVPKETSPASGWNASDISKETPAISKGTPAMSKETSPSGWSALVASKETSIASGWKDYTSANKSSTTTATATFGWGSSTTPASKTSTTSEWESPTDPTPIETPAIIKLTTSSPVAEPVPVTVSSVSPAVSRASPALSKASPAVSRASPAISKASSAISKASPAVSKAYPAITMTSPALARTSSTASPVPAETTTTTGWSSAPAPTETAASGWSASSATAEASNTEWSESPTPAKSSVAPESQTISGWGGSAATKYSSSGWGKSSNYKKQISSPAQSTTPIESFTSPENSGPEETSTFGWGSSSHRETAFRRSANITTSGWATTDEQPTNTRQNGWGNSNSDNWNADKKARMNRQLKDQPRKGRGYLSQKLETTPSPPIEIEQYQDEGDSDSDVEIILEADEEPDWVKNEQILGMTAPGEDSSSEAAIPEKSRYNYSQSYDHSNLQHAEQVSHRNITRTQRKPKRNFDDNWRQRDDVSSDNENRPSIPMHYPQPHHHPHMNTYLSMIPNGANGAPMYAMPFPMGMPTSSSPITGSTSPINSIGGSDSSPHIGHNNIKYYPQLPPPMMNGPNGFPLPPGYEANGMVYYGMDPSAMYAPQPAPFYYYGPPMPGNGPMISPQQRLSPNSHVIMDDDLAEDGWGPSPEVQDGEEQWSSSHNKNASPNNYHNSSAYYIYSHQQ